MSEQSKDKTKRKYVKSLLMEIWTHQHSIFYKNPEHSHQLLEDAARFKKGLGRKFPEQPFLIRVCLKGTGRAKQAWLSIISTRKTDELIKRAEEKFSSPVNVRIRTYSETRAEQAAETIKQKGAHNLKHFFGKDKVNRYSILNEHLLLPDSAEQAEAE